MKMIPLGNTDIALSRMGLGTGLSAAVRHGISNLDMQVCIDTIVEGRTICGINLIDTAPGYNFWQ